MKRPNQLTPNELRVWLYRVQAVINKRQTKVSDEAYMDRLIDRLLGVEHGLLLALGKVQYVDKWLDAVENEPEKALPSWESPPPSSQSPSE